jgi:hypothetical protein
MKLSIYALTKFALLYRCQKLRHVELLGRGKRGRFSNGSQQWKYNIPALLDCKLRRTRYASKHVLAIFEFDKDLSFVIYKSGVQPYTTLRTKFRRNNASQKKRIMLDQPVTVLVYNADGDSAKAPYDFIWEKGMEMTA